MKFNAVFQRHEVIKHKERGYSCFKEYYASFQRDENSIVKRKREEKRREEKRREEKRREEKRRGVEDNDYTDKRAV